MRVPRSVLLMIAMLPGALRAQEPPPTPTPPPQPQPQPPPQPQPQPQPPQPQPQPQPQPAQQPPPVDPTDAARRALERLLQGVQPAPRAPEPGKAAEAGPPAPDRPPKQPPSPSATDPQAKPPAGPPRPGEPPAGPPTGPEPPAATPAGPSTVPAAEPRADLTTETPLYFGGSLTASYRMRHGAGATDQDLVSWLGFDIGRAETDAVTGHFAARGYADLDGARANDPFAGLDESTGDNLVARLYAAHIDAHRIPNLELARIGRQDLVETPVILTFDGIRADSERFGDERFWLSGYAGVPVHQFEASARGDSVFGGAIGCSPWANGRLRLDWMDLRDEYLTVDRHDSLVGIRAWQNVDTVQFTGLYTWLDGDPRDLQLGARGDIDARFHFSADYRELLTTQRAQVTELDPFYEIALDYFPYRQLDVTAGTDIGEAVVIDLGTDLRRLDDGSDERAFNREFERYYANVTVLDVFTRDLSLSVMGSRWDSSGEDFETIAGDFEYQPDKTLRMALGTAYDLFRYDMTSGGERLHVRTWYLRVDRRLSDAVRVVGGYEYERNDDDEFHTVRLEVTWTF